MATVVVRFVDGLFRGDQDLELAMIDYGIDAVGIGLATLHTSDRVCEDAFDLHGLYQIKQIVLNPVCIGQDLTLLINGDDLFLCPARRLFTCG